MTRLRVWLLALALVAIGCGGRVPDDDPSDPDSAVDSGGERDGVSDNNVPRDGDVRSPDVTVDARDANAADAGADRGLDARVDPPDAIGTADAREGGPFRDVVDASRDSDASADILADVHDVSVDADALLDADVFRDQDAADAIDDARDAIDADAAAPPFDAEAGIDGCSPVSCDLVSLSVFPNSPSVIAKTTRWMQAFGNYADNSVREVTNDVVWTTSEPNVAVMSTVANQGGLLTAMNAGVVTVSASAGSISGSTLVNVSVNEPRTFQIRPGAPRLALGTQRQLTAMATFSDGSQADWTSVLAWSSSDLAVATVDGQGIATGVMQGTTTITAAVSGFSASTTLTVTSPTLTALSIAPVTLSLPLGLVQTLRAVGEFSDGTTQDLSAQATWSSSDTSRVTVGDALGTKGKVTGVALGAATITATYGVMSAIVAIDVSDAVLQSIATLAPPQGRLMLGMSMRLASYGHYSDGRDFEITDLITWTSLNPAILKVDGTYVFALREGYAEATATYAGVQGHFVVEVIAGVLESITIDPSPATVARGAYVWMHATGNYFGGTTYDLTMFGGWNTVDGAVAWVETAPASPAKLWGANVGTTQITTSWAGIGGSSVVDVSSMATAAPGD